MGIDKTPAMHLRQKLQAKQLCPIGQAGSCTMLTKPHMHGPTGQGVSCPV